MSFRSSRGVAVGRPSRRGIATLVAAALTASVCAVVPFLTAAPARADVPDRFVIHVPGEARVAPENALISLGAPDEDSVVGTTYGTDDYGWFGLVGLPFDDAPWEITASTFPDIVWALDTPPTTTELWLRPDGTFAQSLALARGAYRIHTSADTGATNARITADGEEVNLSPAGSDSWGPFFDFPVTDATKKFDVQLWRDADEVGAGVRLDATKFGSAWLSSAFNGARFSRAWAEGYAVIHYSRDDANYEGWGMHLWDGYRNDPAQGDPQVQWGKAFQPLADEDVFGVTFKVPLAEGAAKMAWIIHKGDTKSVGADQFLDLAKTGGEVWYVQDDTDSDGNAAFATPLVTGVQADLTKSKAIWINRDLIAWPYEASDSTGYALAYASEGGIRVDEDGIHGAERIVPIENYEMGLPAEILDGQSYLSNYNSLWLPSLGVDTVKEFLRGQVVLVETRGAAASPIRATGIQIGAVLDDITPHDGELGVTWDGSVPTISVWAPTAKNVNLLYYANGTTSKRAVRGMSFDDETGVWSFRGLPSWKGKYYKFEASVFVPAVGAVVANETTDPYSLALSTNSTRTQIVDLNDASTKPSGWDGATKPNLERLADSSVYELHIRDFSVADRTVPAAARGTYGAFASKRSDGMRHLASLAKAGMTHVHLLPAFDFATVNEDKATWVQPDMEYLAALEPDSDAQQAEIDAVRGEDAYNWGYDPYHFTAPEGSFAKSPMGVGRTKEFRSMVQSLNSVGMRTVMDVVYNHTNASGQGEKSTFDKLVPGYYFRLNSDGTVANSTCCSNTATERTMMAKFTRDSLRVWAVDYKVDGFRFDIMGHMPKQLLVDIRADMDALTLDEDGVDGSKILLYGEGWNFGEVANDVRFPQATQINMQYTGVGTFDDRVRDAVRGGGPFDQDPRGQGFGSGLCVDSNGSGIDDLVGCSAALEGTDVIKVALSGSLAGVEEPAFSFIDSGGFDTWGFLVSYNGQPAGYTGEPTEAISYVDSHDDTTLFDTLAFKLPPNTNSAARTRAQIVSLAVPFLSQGIPFTVAGSDLLRSKSLDKNSYDSGDWFNAIDWTGKTNGFGKGLPMYGDNNSRWDVAAETLANPNVKVRSADIKASKERFQDLLRIRYSTPLFRLGSASEVAARLKFPQGGEAQQPGLIVMQLLSDGDELESIDARWKSVVVVFNATSRTASGDVADLVDRSYRLHPVQSRGTDAIVKRATLESGSYSVPARTVAVFVEPR